MSPALQVVSLFRKKGHVEGASRVQSVPCKTKKTKAESYTILVKARAKR